MLRLRGTRSRESRMRRRRKEKRRKRSVSGRREFIVDATKAIKTRHAVEVLLESMPTMCGAI